MIRNAANHCEHCGALGDLQWPYEVTMTILRSPWHEPGALQATKRSEMHYKQPKGRKCISPIQTAINSFLELPKFIYLSMHNNPRKYFTVPSRIFEKLNPFSSLWRSPWITVVSPSMMVTKLHGVAKLLERGMDNVKAWRMVKIPLHMIPTLHLFFCGHVERFLLLGFHFLHRQCFLAVFAGPRWPHLIRGIPLNLESSGTFICLIISRAVQSTLLISLS